MAVPRRGLLAAASILPLAGGAAVGQFHSDADLLQACREHVRARGLVAGTPDGSPEELAYLAALNDVSEAEPQTWDGIWAMVASIFLEAELPNGDHELDGNVAAEWCWTVVLAMHRLRSQTAA